MKTKPAYSYQRFSSIKQKAGDSTGRQTDAAASFAKQFNLDLRQTFSDEGVSGFKGKNFSNESALSEFLKLVDSGDIPEGGVLIVENMDRLSRQSILPCLSKFIEIINRGVSIGVISQGKILDEKSITENPMELMLVLVEFSRANNESETKSKRSKSVIKKKIEAIRNGGKVWFGCQKPSWITGLKDGKFVEDKSRVKVVQSIFEMYLAGCSTNKIADTLNQKQTPTLRLFKDKQTNRMKLWTNSTVAELLRNKNVIGWFGITGSEFNDYFPAIISERDFLLVQNKLYQNVKNRGGSKYGLVRNLFKGLLYCHSCGQVIETKVGSYANAKGGLNHYSHYICRGVKNKNGCTNKYRFNVSDFEQDIFAIVLKKTPDELLLKPKAKTESMIGKLELELLKVNADMNDTVSLIGKVKLPQLESKLTELDKRKTEIEKQLEIENAKEVSINDAPVKITKLKDILDIKGDDMGELDKAMGEMIKVLSDTNKRKQLKNIMPDLFGRIELDFVKAESHLTFTNGIQNIISHYFI